MAELKASAPGKVIIAGEYSVLFGGICIVAPIDRYAQACFKASSHTEMHVRMESIFFRNDADPLWLALMQTAKSYGLAFSPGIYTIDSSSFFDGVTKLGLGSSAAVTVALTKLLLQQQGLNDLHLLHRLSHDAHQEFSAQKGSGVDSAASSFSTSLSFSHKDGIFSIVPIDLSNLWSELSFVFTGRSQNTRPLVKDALAYAKQDRAAVQEFCASSNHLVNALSTKADLSQAIAIFEELAELLKNFGVRAGIDIVSQEHQDIRAIARSLGGSAKPSGAGGGDLSLALIPKTKRAEFKDLLTRAGFSLVLLNQS